MIEDAPFFELSLTDSDGRQITPQRFRTVQDAMTVAEDHRGVAGAILFYAGDDSEPVEVIVYSADGSIAVGDGVPDDDEEWEDDPWTDAEIEHNFRVAEEIEQRRALGLSTRSEDLEANSPEARAELHARVEAERAARSDG
ncbi:MAG: hypothetical protein O2892_17515 [Actinomycetota bacterium]|nr:hypothetical protein [Actinomycetota bacterium]